MAAGKTCSARWSNAFLFLSLLLLGGNDLSWGLHPMLFFLL